jgi:hypothetical protein
MLPIIHSRFNLSFEVVRVECLLLCHNKTEKSVLIAKHGIDGDFKAGKNFLEEFSSRFN